MKRGRSKPSGTGDGKGGAGHLYRRREEREEEKREDEERLCTGSCLGQLCKWSGMTELRRLL
jgi:hypothetical protein